jgi:acetyl esterase
MPVTPEAQSLLDMIAAAGAPPAAEQTPAQMREAYAALSAFAVKDDVAAVEDRTIPGPAGPLPVRVYHPTGAAGRPALLVYFHGGGWSIGSIDTHDAVCRSLANGAGVVVVSVEYRLAPEHPFPAAYDDALAAARWVAASAAELGADAARLAVGGDSAGGNLAAAVAQHLAGGSPQVRFQLLVYPVVARAMSHPSIDENADGYFLTKETMQWFWANYVGARGEDDPADRDPRFSPLDAPAAALAGLPPALVITAEYDPLRDEGEAYAEALRAAGVDVTVTRFDGMIHGFFSMRDVLPEGKAAIDQACEALRAALS